MTPEQAAYFAGVFDSAGVLCVRDHHGVPKPCVELRSADRAVLEQLAAAFGGTIRKTQSSWRWKREGTRAQAVVQQIQPFLRRRRFDAQRVMAWKPMRPGIKVRKAVPILPPELVAAAAHRKVERRGFQRRAV